MKGRKKKNSRRLARSSQVFFLFSRSLALSRSRSLFLSFSPLSTAAIATTSIESATWGKSRGKEVQESSDSASLFFFFPSTCFDLNRSIGWWPISDDDADDDDNNNKKKNKRTVFPSSAQSTRHLSPLVGTSRRL